MLADFDTPECLWSDVHRSGNIRSHAYVVPRAVHEYRAAPMNQAATRGSAVTPTLTPIATRDDELIGADRCDRCGARAKVRVVLAGGMDLAFCGHHAREYDDKLRGVAVNFVDLDASQAPAAAGESLN